jgi:hypothetical protein
MSDYWYQDAIIYGIDVKTFQDSNGDGLGNLRGLISRLDYLQFSGISCLWLAPFYPSLKRDNGYDVTDYCAVDPLLGTLDDFKMLLQEAKKRNCINRSGGNFRSKLRLATDHLRDAGFDVFILLQCTADRRNARNKGIYQCRNGLCTWPKPEFCTRNAQRPLS